MFIILEELVQPLIEGIAGIFTDYTDIVDFLFGRLGQAEGTSVGWWDVFKGFWETLFLFLN